MTTQVNEAVDAAAEATETNEAPKKQRPYTVGYINRRRLTDLASRGFNYVDFQGRDVKDLRLNMTDKPIHLYRNPEPTANTITIAEAREQVDVCTRMYFTEQRKEAAEKIERPQKPKPQRPVNPNSPFAALGGMFAKA